MQTVEEPDDVVTLTEKLAERIRQRLGLSAGQVTVEGIDGGSYLRGFVHLGPLTRDQVRALAALEIIS